MATSRPRPHQPTEPVRGSLVTFLQPEDRDFLLTQGVRRSFARDELLLHEGDPTDHVFVLTSGWVRIFSSTSDGHEVLLALRGPGDVIGDLAALHGWTRTASVRTLEKVTAIQLLSTRFVSYLHSRPAIAIAMVKQMATRLREAENARVDFATLDATKRVAKFVLGLAEDHGVPEDGGLVLRMPLTQQDIANRVGASRRAVARAMSLLRERHIVVTSRNLIKVAQPDVLRMFAKA